MTCQTYPFPQPKVLVVDSDPGVLKLLDLTLRRCTVSVETAGSEAAALASCQRQDFAVLVVGLPRLRALALLDRLAQDRPLPQVLLLLSDFQDPPEQYSTLEKPFPLEALRSKVRQLANHQPDPHGTNSPGTEHHHASLFEKWLALAFPV